MPAGAVIWLIANVQSAASAWPEHLVNLLDPVGLCSA
jgi:hypothetical protein